MRSDKQCVPMPGNAEYAPSLGMTYREWLVGIILASIAPQATLENKEGIVKKAVDLADALMARL